MEKKWHFFQLETNELFKNRCVGRGYKPESCCFNFGGDAVLKIPSVKTNFCQKKPIRFKKNPKFGLSQFL
jgi:hypothetical protein